jgi:hypothetical protein
VTYRVFQITDTTPAVASTAPGSSVSGMADYPIIRVDADLVGATGGTLDVYLQRLVAPGYWTDWAHFAQLAAGAGAIRYALIAGHGLPTTLTPVVSNKGSDGTPSVSMTVNTWGGGHPGNTVRAVYVAGASTSAGAAINIYITGSAAYR